ncbi:hypothetical protein ABT73_09670 [Salmonella enterica subsp. enterica serovar Typhimurium]|nr:hypothetical protein ABT73_09670 [Salmonella enterica subsp. enterica serovar Typhimurium]
MRAVAIEKDVFYFFARSNSSPSQLVVRVARAIDWKVTPHELRPDLYPNPTDGRSNSSPSNL